ncbi:MAG TPA: sigma-70 family RNA polymerase sigma factor [Candidatus Limnocylindrales bacterium]|nr:sigma-70 family RNA polymerase sigma factor [Candidatus Limnocylindrales bacterium]
MTKESAPQGNGHQNGSGTFSPVEHGGLIDALSRPFDRAASVFNMDPEDVRQVAAEHFIRAARRYSPTEEAELTTFVSHRVIGGIKDEFRERGWTIKTSRRISDNLPKVLGATAQLSQTLGRQPTEGEVADHLSISPRLVRRVKIAAAEGAVRPTALVEDSSDQSSSPEKPRAKDPSRTLVAEQGENAYERVLDRMVLKDALASLPPRSRSIIDMHFGFNVEGREMSLMEIAEVLDVTESRVSQLVTKALDDLRKKVGNAA